ncbi:MAG TPA: 50S ribosomal protein L7, partial [Pelotomaculum sp.]|nr:50S ribosomal protein L7 [Pelotomaculum sp.]
MTVERLISLGQRAGKLVSGAFAVKSNLNKGKARLLLIANDTATQS